LISLHKFPIELGVTLKNLISTGEGGALLQAGADSALHEMLHDLHNENWFTVARTDPLHDDNVIHAQIGARQGCPVGAMLFNIVYEFVLAKIRLRLRQAGLLTTIVYDPDATPWQTTGCESSGGARGDAATGSDPISLGVPPSAPTASDTAEICDVEFVDDAVFMFDDASPTLLIAKVAAVLDIIVDTFSEHGLTANLKLGKTEVMLKLIGHHSRTALRELHLDKASGNKLITSPKSRSVQIVDQYQHLGTIRTTSGLMHKDAKLRSSKCTAAFVPVAGNIYANRDISMKTRLMLANGCCFSRLCYGLDT
jgi:hypothetical protein